MIRKCYRSLVLVACVLWATDGIAQHFAFTDVDPNGITVMAGSLALDGQTNWFYYNGSDAPQGGYNGWLFAGQPNTTSGTLRLPAVLSPGRYYIFLWGIDYDQNKTVQCSIGGATTLPIPLNDRDANGRWTDRGVLDVTTASDVLTVTISRNLAVAGDQKLLFEGLFITSNPDLTVTSDGVAVKLTVPSTMDNSAPVKGNLVPNGGFETPIDTSWGFPGQGGGRTVPIQTMWDQTQGHSGQGSLKLSFDSATRLQPGNNGEEILSRVYHLKPNKKYTASMWVKASPTLNTTAKISLVNTYTPPPGYPGQFSIASAAVPVGNAWTRVSVTGYLLEYPTSDYQIIIDTGGPSGTYVSIDDIQLEEGDISDYAAAAEVEAGLFLDTASRPGNIYYTTDSLTATLSVRNNAPAAKSKLLRYEIYDYLNRVVRSGSTNLSIPPNTTQSTPFDLSVGGRQGIFRVVTWIDNDDHTEYEVSYSVIPRPPSTSADPTSSLGIHANYSDAQLKILQRLGMKWSRALSPAAFCRWSIVEPVQGQFVWYDADVQLGNSYGLTTMCTIGTNNYWPAWADNNGLPDLNKWQTFVGQLVTHYKPYIKYWEIWNEPYAAFQPAFYAQMLKAAVDAIEAADPTATIIGMGGDPPTYIQSVIDSMQAQFPSWDWKQHIDVLSTHDYPDGVPPESLKPVMNTYGLPIWNTEAGSWDLGFYQGVDSNFVAWGKALWPHYDAARYYEGMIGAADALTANFLRTVASGQTKYFYYDSRYFAAPNFFVHHPTILEYDGTVRTKGIAYAIAGSLIDHSSGLGNASADPNSYLLVFDKPAGPVAALFSADKKPRQITLGLSSSQFQVLDLMGNVVGISGTTVPYGRIPVYVRGIGISGATLKSALQSGAITTTTDTLAPNVSISDAPRGPITSSNFRVRWIGLDDSSYPNLGEINPEANVSTETPDPLAITYSYNLIGFTQSWSTWSAKTFVDFTNVPNGSYTFSVMARDAFGNQSAAVSRTIIIGGATSLPVITAQPVSQTVTVGQTATFGVVATGNPIPTYQWRNNGAPISGATNSTYTTPPTVTTDNGASFDVVVSNSMGNVTSAAAVLTVNPLPAGAPTITSQPSSQTVSLGQSVTFSVAATGTPAPTYQWNRNGAVIVGATSTTYTIPSTVISDNGATFNVVVMNSGGSVTSNTVTLTIQSPPTITAQPISQTVMVGQSATFTIAATGIPSPTYQWKRSGVNIPGATGQAYSIPATVSGDSGAGFSVVVSNAGGSITSVTATLTVISALTLETAANGTGSAIGNQSVASATSVTIFAIERDGLGNFVANVPAAWSLVNRTGGVVSGDLAPVAGNKSAIFTGHIIGTATVTATASGLGGSSGTLTVTAGAPASVAIETSAAGTGSIVASQQVAAGASVTGYSIQRDLSGNFVGNAAATWFLSNVTGGVVNADLIPAADNRSATFVGRLLGSAKMTAIVGGLGGNSGTLTVVPALAGALTIETAANGTGAAIGPQTLTSGSSLTGFAIQRDTAGNFIANVAASWSLSSATGAVVNTDLIPSGDTKSAVFAAHGTGTVRVAASAGGLNGLTGIFTVTPGAPVSLTVENAGNGGAVISSQNVPANSTVTAFAIVRDASNNFVANVPASWSLTNATGSIAPTDLVPAGNGASVQFTGHLAGSARITASASGLVGSSGVLTVTTNDTVAPTVSITAPLGGTVSGKTVTVSANATDNVGVVGVQFRLDGSNIGSELTTAPYSMIWDTTVISNGAHSLTADARDAAGNKATSAPVAVTVNNADPTPPQVQLTAPPNGATVSGSIVVKADATDNVSIAGVQFSIDGVNLGAEDTVAPYSVVFDTASLPNAIHVIRAIARDPAGNKTSSEALVTVSNSVPTITYNVPPEGAISLLTTDPNNSGLTISHARFSSNAQTSGELAGVAIMGLRKAGVLVTEAGVPAVPPMDSGRIYAGIDGPVTTGIAIANPSAEDATISFYFTDVFGTDFGSGTFILPADGQIAAFLSDAPFNGPPVIHGTFTFTSSVPVGAVSLRGFTNERGEFLITTLPVSSLDAASDSAIIPQFVDGGGWHTQFILSNSTDDPQVGTVQFFGQGSPAQSGELLQLGINGFGGSSFYYWLPPRTSATLVTAGGNGPVQVGSGRVFSTTSAPEAVAVLSYSPSGVAVTEASISGAAQGTAFQMYMESLGTAPQIGSVQSGVGIANVSGNVVTARIELTRMDGSTDGLPSPMTFDVPAGGQVTRFLNQIFQGLPTDYRGIARLTAPSDLVVVALRGRYNERGDFLITTTPPLNEAVRTEGDLIFPHIVNGDGWSTQLTVFGQAGSGKMYMYSQSGVQQTNSSIAVQ